MLVLKRISTLKNVDGTIIDESILEKLKYMGGEPAQTTVAKWIKNQINIKINNIILYQYICKIIYSINLFQFLFFNIDKI